MKYTIELTNKQKKQMDLMCELFHRYVGFNPKLEMDIPIPMTVSPAYKKGFADGKKQAIEEIPELANKENEIYNDGYNKGIEDFENLFVHEHDYEQFFEDTYGSKNPDYNLYDLVAKYGAKKVINDFEKWQEKKKKADEIKEGDIVKFNKKSHVYNIQKDREFLVLHVFKDRNLATILYDNGDTSCVELSLVDKTNRHIDEVSQLLNKLRGEE